MGHKASSWQTVPCGRACLADVTLALVVCWHDALIDVTGCGKVSLSEGKEQKREWEKGSGNPESAEKLGVRYLMTSWQSTECVSQDTTRQWSRQYFSPSEANVASVVLDSHRQIILLSCCRDLVSICHLKDTFKVRHCLSVYFCVWELSSREVNIVKASLLSLCIFILVRSSSNWRSCLLIPRLKLG